MENKIIPSVDYKKEKPNTKKSKKVFWTILVLVVVFSFYIFLSLASKEKPVVQLGEIFVRVFTIEPNTKIKSPLVIKGEARGTWYFEASFPIQIYDANGKLLGTAVAQAQGEWMTENFVPFETTLTFSPPTTKTGEIIFRKDNPSGLPEYDAEFKVPVKF